MASLEQPFEKKQLKAMERLFMRSLVLICMTLMGFVVLELLVWLGRSGYSDINQRFPELLIFMRAATIMTWAEMTLLWIRTTVSPNVDMQAGAIQAASQPMSGAIVYLTNTLLLTVRLVLFLKLCEFLQ